MEKSFRLQMANFFFRVQPTQTASHHTAAKLSSTTDSERPWLVTPMAHRYFSLSPRLFFDVDCTSSSSIQSSPRSSGPLTTQPLASCCCCCWDKPRHREMHGVEVAIGGGGGEKKRHRGQLRWQFQAEMKLYSKWFFHFYPIICTSYLVDQIDLI